MTFCPIKFCPMVKMVYKSNGNKWKPCKFNKDVLGHAVSGCSVFDD